MDAFVPASFGWQPDLPDFRDFTHTTTTVVQALRMLKSRDPGDGNPQRDSRVDLREFLAEPVDQGSLAASTAHACATLVEYFERRSHGRDFRPSRLFLNRVAHRMALAPKGGPVGLRAALKAIAHCGLLPDRFWPYDPKEADLEPDAFLYSSAVRFRRFKYVRLDGRNACGTTVLDVVRSFLGAGFPAVFGLPIPRSISRADEIPYRPTFDSNLGGQALIAVGYDDRWLSSSRGALLVRNSWGAEWGDNGCGWLPYAFVEERLAVDFWTLVRRDWLASGEFSRPTIL